MNYNLSNFTGEITGNLPANFKIPLRSTNGAKKSKQNASQQQDINHSINNGTDLNYNPMNYYQEPTAAKILPTKEQQSSIVRPEKRKLEYTPTEDALPKELTKLMQALACDLCAIKMNSPLSSKMHYDSKNHDKKVNAWLLEWSKKTGEPVPKRGKVRDGPAGPNAFHCDVCDLPLTSQQHASQHYSGRRHRLTLAGRTTPTGSGYYGPDGKWIRTSTKVKVDPTGRFNIGESFIPPADEPVPSAPVSKDQDPDKYCKLCNVSVTSKPQMQLHLEGSKHAKKLRAAGEPPFPTNGKESTLLECVSQSAGISPALAKRDNSIYRTPTGNFYCKPCNCTIAVESIFNQHLDSKKHLSCSKNALQQA